MRKKFLFSLLFLFILLLFGLIKADACSCLRSSSPVSEYKSTPIVFIGTVKSIQEDKVKIQRFGNEEEIRTDLTAYFDVDEAFKGIKEKEATIFTAGNTVACGFPFEVGRKYFVFASPVGKDDENVIALTVLGTSDSSRKKIIVGAAMTTNICTLTNNLEALPEESEMIRAYVKGKPEPIIYGSLREYVYDFDGGVSPKFVGAMKGIKVVAEKANQKFEAQTDENGKFSIKNLTAGKYNLKILLPPTHTMLWDWESANFPIELKSAEDAAQISLAMQISSSLSGKVLNSLGKSAAGQVRLSLIPFESSKELNSETPNRSEYTEANGTYIFTGVKPGKYILGVNVVESPDKSTPYPKTFYPFGGDLTNAQIVEIAPSQKLTGINLKLPKALDKFIVEGLVVSADGKPVAGADLDIYDSETPNKRVFGFGDGIKTDSLGRFKITAFKGRRYLLHAFKDENYLAGTGKQSERVEVIFDETAKNIRLVLNKNGVFINQLK